MSQNVLNEFDRSNCSDTKWENKLYIEKKVKNNCKLAVAVCE